MPDGSGIEFLGDFPTDPRFTFKLDAVDVEFDYLQLLLDVLSDRGLNYVAVDSASPDNADSEFPAIEFDPDCNPSGIPMDLRPTDRDVIMFFSKSMRHPTRPRRGFGHQIMQGWRRNYT